MMWFTLRTSSLMNTSCTPHPNTHCQAAMLGAEQKAFWSAPGQGKGSWFLGRGTDRWCNPEENNQTAELMGKWKILKYHWIKVWLYLYSLMLFSMKKKKKSKKLKSFPSPLSGNKKSVSFEEKTSRLKSWNKGCSWNSHCRPCAGLRSVALDPLSHSTVISLATVANLRAKCLCENCGSIWIWGAQP